MSDLARRWISPEEYLELEALADTKSEYFDGEIFATGDQPNKPRAAYGPVETGQREFGKKDPAVSASNRILSDGAPPRASGSTAGPCERRGS